MPKKFPTFDQCYQAVPDVIKPANFDIFWEEEIQRIKKRPLEPQQKLRIKTSIAKESYYDIQFRGHQDTFIQGYLTLPRKFKKVPLLITLHDYWENLSHLEMVHEKLVSHGIAHLHLYLQSREQLLQKPADDRQNTQNTKSEFVYPPLFLETYRQSSQDYGVFLILDVLRAIDFIRLNKDIQHTEVGILGRGLGAGLAVFAAAFRPESVKVLALERPSLVWIEQFLKWSSSQLALEYQKIVQHRKQKWKRTEEVYAIYSDAIFVAGKIKIPVLMSIGLEDPLHPAYCGFGLFNIIRSEKSMQIFTDENQDPQQRKERTRSIEFIVEHLAS